ncbi:MAG: magnesium/cobalt transporter CorA [Firmicutes bacterium]|nr:magnesium/cobalt transporter CorA [Bacillota bacterium]
MLRILLPGTEEKEEKETLRGLEPGAVKARIAESLAKQEFLWVDLETPAPDEVELLSSVFNFHPLAIEDCLHRLQRPKVDEYPGYLFLVLHAVGPDARGHGQQRQQERGKQQEYGKQQDRGNQRERGNRERQAPGAGGRLFRVAEFDIFVGANFIVTFHWDKLEFVAKLHEEYRASQQLMEKGIGFLLQQILGRLVDEYFPLLDRIEDRLEAIENRIFLSPSQELLSEAFVLRRGILRVRKSLSPQREVLSAILRRDQPFMRPVDRAYFMDVYDHVLRLFDLVDNHHDLLSAALDAYLSSISNRMNEIMKVLTIITTIMMPLSVIAGIYGMNFEYMPELRLRYGYPAALGLMALVSAGMIWFFRRKKWL